MKYRTRTQLCRLQGSLSIALILALQLVGGRQNVATGATPDEIRDLMSDDVIAIAYVDANKLDANSLKAFKPILVKVADQATADALEMQWNGILQIGKGAMGVEEIYVGMIPNDLPQTFGFVAVKLSEAGHLQLAELGSSAGLNAERRGDWTVLWKNVTKRRATLHASSRGESLAEALDAVTKHAVGVAYVPSPDIRRVFKELTPSEIPYFGRGIGPTLSGVTWSALSVDVESATVVAKIRSDTAESAKVLSNILKSAKQELAADKRMENYVTSPAEIAAQLQFKLNDRDIDVSFDQNSLGVIATNLRQQVARARQSQRRRDAANNLKQIGIACHNHADRHKVLPTDSYSKDGKPLLSWRVHILPFMNHQELHAQFHLDEPWNSDHNSKLISQMPTVFVLSDRAGIPAGKTVIQRPSGDGFMGQREPLGFRHITDGTSNSVMTIEAAMPVVWSQPADWSFDKNAFAKSVGAEAETFLIGRGDGSVGEVQRTVPADLFHKMLTIAGGELVDLREFEK